MRLLESARLSTNDPPCWLGLGGWGDGLLHYFIILEVFIVPVLIGDLFLQLIFISLNDIIIKALSHLVHDLIYVALNL